MIQYIHNNKAFALIEILIALSILSIVFVSIFSTVSTSIMAIANNKQKTKAMIIARNKLNEFMLDNLKGGDVSEESVEDYPGFSYSRKTEKFEHPMLSSMPLKLNSTEISIHWKDGQKKKKYALKYVYVQK